MANQNPSFLKVALSGVESCWINDPDMTPKLPVTTTSSFLKKNLTSLDLHLIRLWPKSCPRHDPPQGSLEGFGDLLGIAGSEGAGVDEPGVGGTHLLSLQPTLHAESHCGEFRMQVVLLTKLLITESESDLKRYGSFQFTNAFNSNVNVYRESRMCPSSWAKMRVSSISVHAYTSSFLHAVPKIHSLLTESRSRSRIRSARSRASQPDVRVIRSRFSWHYFQILMGFHCLPNTHTGHFGHVNEPQCVQRLVGCMSARWTVRMIPSQSSVQQERHASSRFREPCRKCCQMQRRASFREAQS